MAFPYSAGDVLTAADLNADFGMVRITTVSVSSATLVNVDNIFSSQFTNYRLVISSRAASAGSYVYMRYRIGATTLTANYYEAVRYQTFTGGSGILTNTNGSEFRVGEMYTRGGAIVDVFQPQAGQCTHTTSYSVYGPSVVTSGSGGGITDNVSAKTGVQILAGGVITWSGEVIVYGYNE